LAGFERHDFNAWLVLQVLSKVLGRLLLEN